MEETKNPELSTKVDFATRTSKGIGLLFWGIILVYIPPYFGITGLWKIPSYVFAVIFINISYLILIELLKRLNSESFANWDDKGIFTVGCFWLWGVIFAYSNDYFNTTGILKEVFFVLSILSLAVSFIGSSIELSKLKNQAEDVAFWKPGLSMTIPGIIICISLIWLELTPFWNIIAMLIALASLALGGSLLIRAVVLKSFYANWLIFRVVSKELSKKPPDKQSEVLDAGPTADINTIAYRTVSLLSLATAVVIIILTFKK